MNQEGKMEVNVQKKLEKQGNDLYEKSKELVIEAVEKKPILKDKKQRDIAIIYQKEAATFKKKINESYKNIYDKQRAAMKATKEEWNKQLEIPKKAYDLLSSAIANFDIEEKRKADEAAEKERKRLEEKRLKKVVELEEKAEKLKEEGKEEEAEIIQEKANEIMDIPDPVVIPTTPPKTKGTTLRRYVKCELVNEEKCINFVLEKIKNGDMEFKKWLSINMPKLRSYVKFHDGKMKPDGVKVWEEYKSSASG